MATPDASSLGFQLVPADDPITPADEALRQAIEGQRPVVSAEQEVAEPFGMSWAFDFDRERFVMNGSLPLEVSGRESLVQWIKAALSTARGAHASVLGSFGLEQLDEPLGLSSPEMVFADYQRYVVDALLVHDRITAVEDVEVSFDETTGVVRLDFVVITDRDDDPLIVRDLTISTDPNGLPNA